MSDEVLGGVVVIVSLNFSSDTWRRSSCVTGTSAETKGVGENDQVIEMARQPVMMLYLIWWKNSLLRRHLQQKLTSLSRSRSQRGYS